MSLVSFYITVSCVQLLFAYCRELNVDIKMFSVLTTVYYIPSYV